MNGLITAISTGFTAFNATNLDDTLENPRLAVLTLVISGLYLLKLVRTVSETLQARSQSLAIVPEGNKQ